MRSQLLTFLLLSSLMLGNVSVWSGSAQTPNEQDDDVIRVETDLTNLFFTATDKQKAFITTLREDDLRLLEDGVPQKILTFQHETDRPLSIAFLIDVSASEEKTLPLEKAAARTFIEAIIQSSKDRAAIIPFTGSAFLEQGLTRDVLSIYRALERVEIAMPAYLGSGKPLTGIASGPGLPATPPEGSTAIWDAIALTASEVLARDSDPRTDSERRPARQASGSIPGGRGPGPNQRRRAIILFTDGVNSTSRLTRTEAINRGLDAETVIYAIGIGGDRYGVDHGALNAVANGTGGRAFFPKRETDLRSAFLEIERELRTQYLIAYSSSNKQRDGSFREMRIEITNPELQKEKLQLRHRPGYFAKPRLASPR
ncbi:MAG TPA: VWA domain-containing protein [Pyrinomonadaceae bacterium]